MQQEHLDQIWKMTILSNMLVYVHPKCSTCQAALRFLEAKQCVFNQQDIVQSPPNLPELQKMLAYQGGNLKKLFNTSGQLYREMGLSEKLSGLSELESLSLLSQYGMLVKRPFLLTKDFGLVGFNPKTWSAAF